MKCKRRIAACLAAAALLAIGSARAGSINGFENPGDENDWSASSSITRVASGGGTLGLPSSSGNWHAEITNLHDGGGYAGYGDGGSTYYGLPGRSSTYGGKVVQSLDIYVQPNWAAPAATYSPAFWLDMASGPPGQYGSEHNFRFTATGSQVTISADGDASPFATITNAGWYTFQMTWEKGALPTDLVTSTLSVSQAGSVLGSVNKLGNSPGGPLLSKDLGGTGYAWLTLWQNGFAGDVLAIDNSNGAVVPLPAAAWMGLGLMGSMGGFKGIKRLRRQRI